MSTRRRDRSGGLTVHKFGGASLADAKAMKNAIALGRGEEIAARIFAAGLTAAGRPAVRVSPLDLIATDGRFGSASPLLSETDRNVRRVLQPHLRRHVIPVVAGFLGAAPDGRVATLGR